MRYNYSRTDEGAAVIGKSARKLAARRELLQQTNADALCAATDCRPQQYATVFRKADARRLCDADKGKRRTKARNAPNARPLPRKNYICFRS